MTKSHSPQPTFWNVAFALVVTGLGIGWLIGLAVSPVVSIVVTGLTGAVATVIAALSGVREESWNAETSPNTLRRMVRGVTPVPLMWLVGIITDTIKLAAIVEEVLCADMAQ